MGHRQISTSSSSPRHTRRTSTPPPRLERAPVVSSFVSRVLSDSGPAPASRRIGAIIGGTRRTLFCYCLPHTSLLSSLYPFCFLRMSSRAQRRPSTVGFLSLPRPVLFAEPLVVCACPLTLFARFVFSSPFGEDAPRIFSCDMPRLLPIPSRNVPSSFWMSFLCAARTQTYIRTAFCLGAARKKGGRFARKGSALRLCLAWGSRNNELRAERSLAAVPSFWRRFVCPPATRRGRFVPLLASPLRPVPLRPLPFF